jgi:hypothetical protein
MSESKKYVKHVPREASAVKRKSQEKVVKVKAIKVERPPIPDEKIEELLRKYSLPTATDKMKNQCVDIWALVTEIKGYLTKAAILPTLMPMHKSLWPDLRAILDDAIQENNPAVFEEFTKAWLSLEIRNEVRRNSSKKLGTTGKANLAASIEDLIPNLPSKKSKSPLAFEILNIIQNLQCTKRLRGMRAPTQAEIVTASGKKEQHEYIKGFNRVLKKMELLDLLSEH